MNTIIFSKDNPGQLFTTISSIRKFAKDIDYIKVLYDFSTPQFEEGYNKLISESDQKINFTRQTDFKNNILHMVQTNSEFTLFLTDQDVFFKEVFFGEANKAMSDQDVFCFSMRLGKNTTFCYQAKSMNTLYGEEIDGMTMKWNWQKHYLDYGSVVMFNGHMFRTKEIMKLIKQVSCKNHEELEENLQIFENFPREKMASFVESVLITLPSEVEVKKVLEISGDLTQTAVEDKDFEIIKQNPLYLCSKLLNNERIDINKMNFKDIQSAERLTEFKF